MNEPKSQFIEDAIVLANVAVNYDTFEIILDSPKIARVATPGQFIMISCAKSGSSPLLRRPISIHDIDGDKVSLLYKVIGSGTALMKDMSVDESVSLLGPLGQGFTVADTHHHCLVGGGIGTAPLVHLGKEILATNSDAQLTFLEGARTADDLIILDKFSALGDVKVSTDDGSEGLHGFVTALLSDITYSDMTVYTCGPIPMMKGVAAIAKQHGWKCQVAMETHMACGMGACLGCSYPRAGEHEGVEKYLHVCKDGPVLDSEILWD